MKKILRFLKKCKKGFTLMECVCAIALVGILSAIILPLTASGVKSMQASDNLRKTATTASASNATKKTVTTGNGKNVKTMYVTVKYDTAGLTGSSSSWGQESAFVFTESTEKGDTKYDVQVTYYDLKYGMETENPVD